MKWSLLPTLFPCSPDTAPPHRQFLTGFLDPSRLSLCTTTMNIQWVLTTHGFRICKFFYSLKFMYNPQIHCLATLWKSLMDTQEAVGHWICPTRVPSWGCPAWRAALLLLLPCYKQVSFSQSVSCHIFHIFVLPVDFAVLKWLRCGADTLASAPKCKVARDLWRTYLLDKLCLNKLWGCWLWVWCLRTSNIY